MSLFFVQFLATLLLGVFTSGVMAYRRKAKRAFMAA